MADNIRIDKFLWAVRIYKTRTIASEAIKRGRITMGGVQVKGARTVKEGDVVEVRVPPATRSFKVLQIPKSRMGAKLVMEYIREVTPKDMLELIELNKLALSMNRRRGLGRPTQKERRDLDGFFDGDDNEDFDIDFDNEENDTLE